MSEHGILFDHSGKSHEIIITKCPHNLAINEEVPGIIFKKSVNKCYKKMFKCYCYLFSDFIIKQNQRLFLFFLFIFKSIFLVTLYLSIYFFRVIDTSMNDGYLCRFCLSCPNMSKQNRRTDGRTHTCKVSETSCV